MGNDYIKYQKTCEHNFDIESDSKSEGNSTIQSKYVVKALSKALCYTQRILRETGLGTERNSLLPRILITQVSTLYWLLMYLCFCFL